MYTRRNGHGSKSAEEAPCHIATCEIYRIASRRVVGKIGQDRLLELGLELRDRQSRRYTGLGGPDGGSCARSKNPDPAAVHRIPTRKRSGRIEHLRYVSRLIYAKVLEERAVQFAVAGDMGRVRNASLPCLLGLSHFR